MGCVRLRVGLNPLLRTRLPLPSRAFDTPLCTCACAAARQASKPNITPAALIFASATIIRRFHFRSLIEAMRGVIAAGDLRPELAEIPGHVLSRLDDAGGTMPGTANHSVALGPTVN
jgi:hypothetical protein